MCQRNRYEVIVIRGRRIVGREVFGSKGRCYEFVARRKAAGFTCEVVVSQVQCAHRVTTVGVGAALLVFAVLAAGLFLPPRVKITTSIPKTVICLGGVA